MAKRVDQFLVDDIRSTMPEGRVLDIPTGGGHISKLLVEEGYDVTPADLFPEYFKQEGLEAVKADMNERLPFEDNSFDILVCQEGVEHLENLALFFRECGRVLRDGGMAWITTPNFMDLSSRLSYFMTGMKSFRSGFPNEETTVWGGENDRLYYGHAFTLPFFQIRYLLRLCHFDDITVKGLGRSTTSTVLYPFVRTVSGILVSNAWRNRRNKKHKHRGKAAESPELNDELKQQAMSPELLCYKKICVRAVLREGSFSL